MSTNNFNKDPGLKKNESFRKTTQGNDPYGWNTKMKNMPSFESHMKSINKNNAKNNGQSR